MENALLYKSINKAIREEVIGTKTITTCGILPELTYGCGTWTMNYLIKPKLWTAEKGTERSILGFTRIEWKTSEYRRSVTNVGDVINSVRACCLKKDNRLTGTVLDWNRRDEEDGD